MKSYRQPITISDYSSSVFSALLVRCRNNGKIMLPGFLALLIVLNCYPLSGFATNVYNRSGILDPGNTEPSGGMTGSGVQHGNKQDPGPATIFKKGISGWIGLTARNVSAGNLQESYILLNPEATTGFDPLFDSEYVPGDGPRFYSLVGDEKLSTNSVPTLSSQTEIEFVFVPNQGSQFEIEASGLEMIMEPVYLYDNKTRSDQNLSQNPVYSFAATSGDDSTRFKIHFGSTGLEDPLAESPVNAWYSNESLHFNNLGNTGMVILFDLQGKMIRQIQVRDIQNQSYPVRLNQGMYIIRITTGQNSTLSKILVQ